MQLFDGSNVDFMAGQLILVNKPLAWSSFDVVNKLRQLICKQIHVDKLRVGHAGTLDPMATGLLLICTGRATKEIESLQDFDKEYLATLKFGATTPSFDSETEMDACFEFSHITKDALIICLKNFVGEIEQIPPHFSAVKLQGKRAYKIARKGKNPEIKPRTIKITQISLEHFNLPIVTIRVCCGKGTYIRSLARDIGAAMNSGAYLTGLIRTKSGDFSLEDAYEIDEIEKIIRNM
ncbi:MAG: tRNA pseudouridine(55) synthase TruB [Bacteroidales bacterium]|nr:tRNA pseudouridine(55) synthase TruB [Bacteroidales bacterium]HOY38411.1 tRNA pseudouridine(55) synthase TruB [Bacteroidales bacterium]HQP05118.1 tRNA pseudouridine(55) synthase TruB [Bacteroidales bacterium]